MGSDRINKARARVKTNMRDSPFPLATARLPDWMDYKMGGTIISLPAEVYPPSVVTRLPGSFSPVGIGAERGRGGQ